MFLQIRTGTDWAQERTRLKSWIAKGAEN